MVRIFEGVSLKDKNKFAVDAKAQHYVEINNEQQIHSLLESEVSKKNKKFILGEGSNVLFIEDFEGIVIRLTNNNVQVISNGKWEASLLVGAGVSWAELVQQTLKRGFFGLENLAQIPGSVGGAIVQNIGAYGVEIEEFVTEVRGFNIEKWSYEKLERKECRFGYRSSIFKTELKDKFIISSVVLKLSKIPKPNLSHDELKKKVKVFPFFRPTPKKIYTAVCNLRSSKLPDPSVLPNCGSFFKNPVIDEEEFLRIKENNSNIPYYRTKNGKYKIPAGWLIEQLGWKGKRIGKVGTYEHHSLVIVNYGTSSGKEILDFARMLRNEVFAKFKILLENEVVIVANNPEPL
ncbi:MAG: UDP-N-acetylmuramate dehydrogenase [Ignavibacteria bacterium]|nr:UDP-N-acetylmuramate dehydrogenase [Ignavibacteria bacterium]